jgi:hypothetical protein
MFLETLAFTFPVFVNHSSNYNFLLMVYLLKVCPHAASIPAVKVIRADSINIQF